MGLRLPRSRPVGPAHVRSAASLIVPRVKARDDPGVVLEENTMHIRELVLIAAAPLVLAACSPHSGADRAPSSDSQPSTSGSNPNPPTAPSPGPGSAMQDNSGTPSPQTAPADQTPAPSQEPQTQPPPR